MGLGEAVILNSFSDEIHGLPPMERPIDNLIISINDDNSYQSEAVSKRETEYIIGKALW
ncbi:MAG: hypothetical protein ACP5MU_05130 [Thermoplasmata archaeon]